MQVVRQLVRTKIGRHRYLALTARVEWRDRRAPGCALDTCGGMDTPARDELPAELRAFLYSCIDSIEQVEILMMLRAAGHGCTTRAVASSLGLAEPAARSHLETLTARGLLHAEPGREVTYAFRPKTAALAGYAELLAGHHAQARSAVLRFVATSSRRTRIFADAFRLRDTE